MSIESYNLANVHYFILCRCGGMNKTNLIINFFRICWRFSYLIRKNRIFATMIYSKRALLLQKLLKTTSSHNKRLHNPPITKQEKSRLKPLICRFRDHRSSLACNYLMQLSLLSQNRFLIFFYYLSFT